MVRMRRGANEETIQLNILAPKSLLASQVQIEAPLQSTWYDVLKDQLGLNLTPEQGIFACTMAYTPTAPRDGGGWRNGWRAELSETVGEYVNRYERRKKQYAVRLCDPNILSTFMREDTPRTLNNARFRRSATPATSGTGNTSRRRRRSSSSRRRRSSSVGPQRSSGNGPQIVIPTQGGGGAVLQGPGLNGHVVADYSRPRYVHTVPVNRRQQQHYSTRLKRQLEQDQTEGSSSSGQRREPAQRSPAKQPRGGVMTNANARQAPAVASTSNARVNQPSRFTNVRTLTSVSVKVENPDGLTEEHGTVNEFWDESDETFGHAGEEEEEEGMGGQEDEDDLEEGAEAADIRYNGNLQNGVQSNQSYQQDQEDDDDDDYDDDAESLCTAATQEETELIREGIRLEDVKRLAELRVGRFSNGFMLRVKSEINKLQRNNLWDRNVKRSPLACYLLQEIFKDEHF